jgi:hypothetical protein
VGVRLVWVAADSSSSSMGGFSFPGPAQIASTAAELAAPAARAKVPQARRASPLSPTLTHPLAMTDANTRAWCKPPPASSPGLVRRTRQGGWQAPQYSQMAWMVLGRKNQDLAGLHGARPAKLTLHEVKRHHTEEVRKQRVEA